MIIINKTIRKGRRQSYTKDYNKTRQGCFSREVH